MKSGTWIGREGWMEMRTDRQRGKSKEMEIRTSPPLILLARINGGTVVRLVARTGTGRRTKTRTYR
jgi:hypothetical protein